MNSWRRAVKNGLRTFFLISMSLAMLACVSNKELPEPDLFSTQVLADGSKRFVFAVRTTTARARLDQRQPLDILALREYLDDYLEQQSFCQQGYFIYDQQFDGAAYKFLGECQESATD